MFKQLIDLFEMLDSPSANAEEVRDYLLAHGECSVEIERLQGTQGSTQLIKVLIQGRDGRSSGGSSPTLGVIGRLGGLGARPEVVGFVSDGDGALAALAVAAKLSKMRKLGDVLDGDVVVSTHICPNAPTQDHKPVRFMGSPITQAQANAAEISANLDAVLSIDTTKGNRIINHRGFAISPTVKEGYILKVSEDLLDVMSWTTGTLPRVFPLSQQDITPYGNDLYHMNSILQPCVATTAPVVGVAITTEVAVPGCASGATHMVDVEQAARFAIEVAKGFTTGRCSFFDADEFNKMQQMYGSMAHFQTAGEA